MKKDITKKYNMVFEDYFEDYEIKHEFKKEFISLWSGWLDKDNYHKLDEVTESEWERFNALIRSISKQYELLLVNLDQKAISSIDDIDKTLLNYDDYMNKSGSEFSIYIIPELNSIITEDWDYTFIIWYKNDNVIKKLKPIIEESELYHFT